MNRLEILTKALNVDVNDKDAVISLQYAIIQEMRDQLDSYYEMSENMLKVIMDQRAVIKEAMQKSLSLESQLVLANPVTEVFNLN